jgi:hypothetical protein
MYRLRIKYRQGSTTGTMTINADGRSESAAKAALMRMSSSYANAIILDVEVE